MAPTTSIDELEPEVQGGGIELRGTQMGDMAVGFETWPVGNYDALFEGLEHGCQATHHGYVISGRFRITYEDGSADDVSAGQVYYAPAGHRFEVLEPVTVVEFTRADGVYEQTMKVVEKNLPQFIEASKQP